MFERIAQSRFARSLSPAMMCLMSAAALCLPFTADAVSITGFSPSLGQPGNIILINGSGFTSATLVQFNINNPVPADFNINSDSQLAVVLPLGATTGFLSVTAGGTTVNTTSNFNVAPRIYGFTPVSGASPTVISISGANFVTNSTTVTFTGASPTNGTVISATEVSVAVPTNATNGPITVTTSAGSDTSTNSFIDSTQPTITDFYPSVATNGSSINIDGGNFIPGTIVKFGAVKATTLSIVSLTEITVTVPSSATSGALTVSNANGTFTTSSNFMTGAGPIITDFSPTFGPPYPAFTAVQIDGFNLYPFTGVYFGNTQVPANEITSASSTSLQVYVPAGATTGAIKVVTSLGTYTTSSNFVTSTAPVITDFSPTVGATGTEVVIDGFNFTSVNSVFFGAAQVASVDFFVSSDTEITAFAPSGSGGAIKVTGTAGSYTTTSNFVTTSGAPVVSSFTPASGVRGSTVTITGGNFTNLSNPAVKFNGVAGTYITPTSTSVLQAIVPGGASSGPISVINNIGPGVDTNIFYLQPWITNFSPSATIVNSNITIVGRNLTNALSVLINGTPYAFSATATQIVATVPTNATTGLIKIVAPGGIIISTNQFIVLPKIDGFSPWIGPAGTVVTITGTSLFNVTNVQFNGSNAAPYNISTNQLSVNVPTGARPGPVTVFAQYGTSTTASNFIATYATDIALTMTAVPEIALPGQTLSYIITVTNEGPSIATSVNFTDNLPAVFTNALASCTLGSCNLTNSVLTWNLAILTNDKSATINVTGSTYQTGSFTNFTTVMNAENYANEFDNSYGSLIDYVISNSQRTLSIGATTNGLLISWPVSQMSFALQFTTNTFFTNWQAVIPSPVQINGKYYFTNAYSVPDAFFRLYYP